MKRRSATSSPPELVFFSDENLGRRIFPDRLRAAGIPLEVHADHFSQGTADLEWLTVVAARGWVLLTLDANLRYNRLERDAIMESALAAFVLVGGKTHREKADIVVAARGRIERFVARHEPPFIAKIYSGGSIGLWLDEERWQAKGSR